MESYSLWNVLDQLQNGTERKSKNQQKCDVLHFSGAGKVLTWGSIEKCNLPRFLKG